MKIFLYILLLTIIFPQVTQDKMIDIKTGMIIDPEKNDQIIENQQIYILDRQISTTDYILGPGDALALNIVSAESYTYDLKVSPTGDVLIPMIGAINVGGLSVYEGEKKVRNFLENNFYPNAKIDLVLTNIREFKIKVQGAVNDPGYVRITSNQRLYDVIQEAGGFHRDANESKIDIIKPDSSVVTFSLKYYNHDNDDANNPFINIEEVIFVPFEHLDNQIIDQIITAKQNPINITGYAHKPGEYPYYLGFTVIDYINMAGGALDKGSLSRVALYRKGQSINPELTDYVLPGDQLYVPANFRYRIFGESSIIRTATAVLSLYLTFLAIQN